MNQCLQCCHSTSVKMTGSSGAERSRCLKTSVYISISYNKLQSKFKNWHWGFPLDLLSPLYVFSRSHVHLETWNMNFLQMFPWSNMDMKPNNYRWVARGILFQKPRHDHTIKGFQSTHYLQRTFGTFLVFLLRPLLHIHLQHRVPSNIPHHFDEFLENNRIRKSVLRWHNAQVSVECSKKELWGLCFATPTSPSFWDLSGFIWSTHTSCRVVRDELLLASNSNCSITMGGGLVQSPTWRAMKGTKRPWFTMAGLYHFR